MAGGRIERVTAGETMAISIPGARPPGTPSRALKRPAGFLIRRAWGVEQERLLTKRVEEETPRGLSGQVTTPRLGGPAMPITPFLDGQRFDLETKRVLGVAFEITYIALQIEGADDFVKQAIATKIIELAKAGERNPDLLCEQVLKDIRGQEV